MNPIYQKVQQMRQEQEAEAGPFFAELSTHESWREILRWMISNQGAEFTTQMTEIAAMAMWAVEANDESARLDRQPKAFIEQPVTPDLPVSRSFETKYGPIDRPLPLRMQIPRRS